MLLKQSPPNAVVMIVVVVTIMVGIVDIIGIIVDWPAKVGIVDRK